MPPPPPVKAIPQIPKPKKLKIASPPLPSKKNTPRKCMNFEKIVKQFSREENSTPPKRISGKKPRPKPILPNLSSKSEAQSDIECKKTTSHVNSTSRNSEKNSSNTRPPPPASKNLLKDMAVGKIYRKENLEIEARMSHTRPAPTNLQLSAVISSAPKQQNFQNSNFGGKNTDLPPSQSEVRSNFSKASKNTDWTALQGASSRPTKLELE